MPTFHHLGHLQLRDFYSVDIVEEGDAWAVYFNSRIHRVKRTRIGPSYSKEFTFEQILRDVHQHVVNRWPDCTYCPHCGT